MTFAVCSKLLQQLPVDSFSELVNCIDLDAYGVQEDLSMYHWECGRINIGI